MTAYPDPNARFAAPAGVDADAAQAPRVTERFWGYEIAPAEVVLDLGVLLRLAVVLIAASAALASLLIWLVPAMAFAGHAPMTKLAASMILFSLSALLAYRVYLGGRVLLQVDTSRGELREVARNIFGTDIALATYGIEAVEDVILHESEDTGQIQIHIEGAGMIPAGDGHPVMLLALRDRLRGDLQVAGDEVPILPDFAGPLAA